MFLFKYIHYVVPLNLSLEQPKGWFPYNRSRSLLIAGDPDRLMAILWKRFPAIAIAHDCCDRKCSIWAILSVLQPSSAIAGDDMETKISDLVIEQQWQKRNGRSET